MHSIFLATLAATSVYAQGDYVSGLQAALRSNGAGALATALGVVPASLLEALQQGNHTVFAPNDAAIAQVPQSVLTNPAALANVIAYHVVSHVVMLDDTSPNNHTIVRTALRGAPAVLLPGNQTQVLVLTESEQGALTVVQGDETVESAGTASYANLQVQVIPRVLTVPGNLSTVLTGSDETSSLVAAVGGLDGLLTGLENTRGLTVFAPRNSAFEAAADVLAAANATVVANVLSNHLINGTALYSTLIQNGTSITSAGGQELSFTVNNTGAYVTSGSSTARIVETDWITNNGVVHLIEGILLNTESNPDAAQSAAASFSSVQATQTEVATQPLAPTSGGAAPSPTDGSGGNQGGSASTLKVSLGALSTLFIGGIISSLL